MSLWDNDFISFGYIPRSGIVGSHDSSIFIYFWGTFIMFSIETVLVYIPTPSVQVFPFFPPHSHQYLLSLIFCITAFLTGMNWFLTVVLVYISLMISDAEYLLMYLLIIWISSLENCPFRCIGHLLIQLFRVLLLSGMDFLSNMWFANIFFHSISCLFTLLMDFFAVQELFSLDVVPLVYICFCCLCFMCHIQKSIAKTNVKSFDTFPIHFFQAFLWFYVLHLSINI